MEIGAWHSQLRKGAAELAMLSVISRGEIYGLRLLQEVNSRGELVTAGALYPLLNRLEKEGKVVSRWSFDQGATHPRKYYRLTADGESLLAAMVAAWTDFRASLSFLVEAQ